jgi:hypothetical protein
MQRKITITLEYNLDSESCSLWDVINNIKRLINEDMPQLKITSIRDKPIYEEADNE